MVSTDLTSMQLNVSARLRSIDQRADAAERLPALRGFLRAETQRLLLRHRAGAEGARIVAARSVIVDLVIERLAAPAARAVDQEQVAVIALGGYGRRELAPQTDVDVLFLYRGRRAAAAAEALAQSLLYAMWDVGLHVGHSVRSIAQCLEMAGDDLVSLTAMLDLRLLLGSEPLVQELSERIGREVLGRRRRVLLDELWQVRGGRPLAFGDGVGAAEPNVKENPGGLRDLHTLLWAGRIASGAGRLPDLARAGAVSERDARALGAAYELLLRVRNDIHFQTARKSDVLALDLQPQVARNLGYADSPQQQASERFMRDYYLHARRLNRVCERALERMVTAEPRRGWFTTGRATAAAGGFVLRDGVLDLDRIAGGTVVLDPGRALQAFSHAQATGAFLSRNLKDALTDSLPSIGRRLRGATAVADEFLQLLRARGRVGATLRAMHDLDFLGRLVPDFGRLTCLVQHDAYHRYTVDEHTLRTIEVLDRLAGTRCQSLARYRELYDRVPDPALLHLALLLHDAGKGQGSGHAERGAQIAERVCQRLGLDRRARELVAFLVRHHLLLSHIAQRRDLSDDKVIRDFAASVGEPTALDLLALLTYADMNGVGPDVWNEWKDALVWELYTRARAVVEPGEGAFGRTLERQRLAATLDGGVASEAELELHLRLLPADYARFTTDATLVEHLRLVRGVSVEGLGAEADPERPGVVRTSWRVDHKARCTDLHLCARNRRGLLAAVTGALAAEGVNILSVQLNTRADGLAIDTFKVCDAAGEPIAEPSVWQRLDETIDQAVAGRLDIAARVDKRLRAMSEGEGHYRRASRPGRVRVDWDNVSSDRSSILEVRAGDRLGLAYRIASTLARSGLDISFAKVATEKNMALDIFYVTNAAGGKLEDAELPAVEREIRRAIGDAQEDPTDPSEQTLERKP